MNQSRDDLQVSVDRALTAARIAAEGEARTRRAEVEQEFYCSGP